MSNENKQLKKPSEWKQELACSEVEFLICQQVNKWAAHDYNFSLTPLVISKEDFLKSMQLANLPLPQKHIAFNAKGEKL